MNVTEDGESSIVIYAGANSLLTPSFIRQQQKYFNGAAACLLSAEIPLAAVQETLTLCAEKHVPVLFKPAGLDDFPRELLKKVTYLIPNRRELNMLVPGTGTVAEKAQSLLTEYDVQHVIVTLANEGCYLAGPDGAQQFPAMDIAAVDTTGGADAFIGALAVYLAEGNQLVRAIGFATYAAGLCIAGRGVQAAMPWRNTLEAYQEEVCSNFSQ